MADYYALKVVYMARILAIVHIVVGSLLICFGIADIAVQYFWSGHGCWGIWMGVWVSLPPVYDIDLRASTHGQAFALLMCLYVVDTFTKNQGLEVCISY